MTLDTIPTGWRFYSCDWSIPTRCSIALIRAGEGRDKWNTLTEKQQDKIHLFVSGSGSDFDQALADAVGNCTEI